MSEISSNRHVILTSLHLDILSQVLDLLGLHSIMRLWKTGNLVLRQRLSHAVQSLHLVCVTRDPTFFPTDFISNLRSLRELTLSSDSDMFTARVVDLHRSKLPTSLRKLKLMTNNSFGNLTQRTSSAIVPDLSTVFPHINLLELCAPLQTILNPSISFGSRLESFKNCNQLSSLILHRVSVDGSDINILPRCLTQLRLTIDEDWMGAWSDVNFPPALLELKLFQLPRYKGFLDQLRNSCPHLHALEASWSFATDQQTETNEESFWADLPRSLLSLSLIGGPKILTAEGAALMPKELVSLSLVLTGLYPSCIRLLPRSLTYLSLIDEDRSYNRKGFLHYGDARRLERNPSEPSYTFSWTDFPRSLTHLAFNSDNIYTFNIRYWPHFNQLKELPKSVDLQTSTPLDFSYHALYLDFKWLDIARLSQLPSSLTKLVVREFTASAIEALSFLPLTTLSLSYQPDTAYNLTYNTKFYLALGKLKHLRYLSFNQLFDVAEYSLTGKTLDVLSLGGINQTSSIEWSNSEEVVEALEIRPDIHGPKDPSSSSESSKSSDNIGQWSIARDISVSTSHATLVSFLRACPLSMPLLTKLTYTGSFSRPLDSGPLLSLKCSSLTSLRIVTPPKFAISDFKTFPPLIRYLHIESNELSRTIKASTKDLIESLPADLIEFNIRYLFTLLTDDGKEPVVGDTIIVKKAKERIATSKPRWVRFVQLGQEPHHLFWQRPLSSSEFDQNLSQNL